jgi:hypothetical protein
MFWCKKPLRTFEVTLRLGGRHPYLKETHLDYPDQDVTVTVAAKNWNDAEQVALWLQDLPKHWRRSVSSIKAV